MSAKDDGSKGTKTKKKKTAKAEGKAKDNVEEQVLKEENIKEETENVQDVDKNTAEVEEKRVDDAPKTQQDGDKKPENIEKEKDSKKEENKKAESKKKESKKEEKVEIKPMDLEKLVELKEAFSLFDFNRDGIIDLQDLKYTFASMGRPDYPEEEMKKMLSETTDPCDFDAFVALFGYKVSTLDTEDVFRNALATWDMKGVGMIPEQRLKRDIQCFGDKFTGKETDNALEEAPVFVNEGASMIDYTKFSNNICGFQNVEKTRRYQKELEGQK